MEKNRSRLQPFKALSGITQGPGESQRLGRKIRVKAVVFRGRSEIGVAANNAHCPYTLDFIWDKQCNGAAPTVTQIYTSGSSYALPNPENDERFEFAKRVSRDNPNSNVQLDFSFSYNHYFIF